VAVLARLLTRHGNRVGAMLYGAGVDTVIPAAAAAAMHVLHLLHSMQSGPHRMPSPGRHPAARAAADSAASTIRGAPPYFVVSDFISEPGWEKPLAQLAQRHDVVAVRLLDPLELELPDLGLVPCATPKPASNCWSTRTTRLSPALCPHRRAARGRAAPGLAARPAWTRWNCPPTTTWSTPSAIHRAAQAPQPDRAAGGLAHACARRRRLPWLTSRRTRMNSPMTFLWPQFLWLLLAVPLLVAAVRVAAAPQEETGAALCQPVHRQGGHGPRPAHAPPHSAGAVPAGHGGDAAGRGAPVGRDHPALNQQTIILAMDVSGSMRATDVKPNRLVAAQNAAKAFLAELPRHVKVGIVAFAGTAPRWRSCPP
jgi:hypothetical protein